MFRIFVKFHIGILFYAKSFACVTVVCFLIFFFFLIYVDLWPAFPLFRVTQEGKVSVIVKIMEMLYFQ